MASEKVEIFHYKTASNVKYKVSLINTWCFVEYVKYIDGIFIANIPDYNIKTVYENIEKFDTSIYHNGYDSTIKFGTIVLELNESSREEMLICIIKSFEYYEEKILANISNKDYYKNYDHYECSKTAKVTELNDIMERYQSKNIKDSELFKAIENQANIISEIDASGSSITTLASTITNLRKTNTLHLSEIAALKKTIANQKEQINGVIKDRDTWKINYEKLDSDKNIFKQKIKEEIGNIINKI